jgi:hypothetical protein
MNFNQHAAFAIAGIRFDVFPLSQEDVLIAYQASNG